MNRRGAAPLRKKSLSSWNDGLASRATMSTLCRVLREVREGCFVGECDACGARSEEIPNRELALTRLMLKGWRGRTRKPDGVTETWCRECGAAPSMRIRPRDP